MLNENLKKLIGSDTISEETVIKLSEMIQEHVAAEVLTAKQALQEEVDAKQKDLEDKEEALKEKDEEIKAKDEALKEKSEEVEAMKCEKEELVKKADAYMEETKEELEGRSKEAIEEAVQQLVEENAERFKQLEDYARMKTVFEAVKTVFEANGFELDNAVAIKEKEKELAQIVESYDSLFEEFGAIRDELEDKTKKLVIAESTKDLTEVQKEKFEQLLSDTEYLSEDKFRVSVAELVEKVSSVTAKDTKEEVEKLEESTDPRMKKYLDFYNSKK